MGGEEPPVVFLTLTVLARFLTVVADKKKVQLRPQEDTGVTLESLEWLNRLSNWLQVQEKIDTMVAALKKEQANEVKKKDQTGTFCFCFQVSLCGISFSSWIFYDFVLIILSTVSYSI